MTIRRLAYSLALVLAAAACGDSDNPDSTSSDPREANDAGAGGNRPGAGGAGGEGSVDDGGGEGGQGGDGGDLGGGGGGGSNLPDSLTVHLERIFDGGDVVSFGLPLPRGKVVEPSQVRVSLNEAPIDASVTAILMNHDADGRETHPRSLLVQFPSSLMTASSMDLEIAFEGGSASAGSVTPFSAISAESKDVVVTADRTIEKVSGENRLVETRTQERTLFTGREPRVLATFPKGYLASTGILGHQLTDEEVLASDSRALSYLSGAMKNFASSAMYREGYKLSSHVDSKDAYGGAVVDPVANFEGWLYDRCATFLTAYAHSGDQAFLRHALRSCSYYSSKIRTTGSNPGIFTGKSSDDTKYSHLRGLYAYYALTGDEGALASGKAIADMWHDDKPFVAPYRQGRLGGRERLWTERLLGTSLEGLYYGHALTGETKYLTAFREMLTTAHRHITGDASVLAEINPGHDFPPQNCFIHSALQHSEGDANEPWCSGWMAELILDPLLRYEEQTGDARVSEIFIRLARFLRDTGSAYFSRNLLNDSFLEPSVCYDASQGDAVRRLVPLYGSGLRANGRRDNYGEYDDIEHCADATALTAAAIRALVQQGKFDEGGPIGPFASEGESFVALHHELSACAKLTFSDWTRLRRDPSRWTSSELAAGVSNPASFIVSNKIGWPSYAVSPMRKLSWWFNMSMLQFGLLEDAGISMTTLEPGKVQKSGCR